MVSALLFVFQILAHMFRCCFHFESCFCQRLHWEMFFTMSLPINLLFQLAIDATKLDEIYMPKNNSSKILLPQKDKCLLISNAVQFVFFVSAKKIMRMRTRLFRLIKHSSILSVLSIRLVALRFLTSNLISN